MINRRDFLIGGVLSAGASLSGVSAFAHSTSRWLGGGDTNHVRYIIKNYFEWHQRAVYDFSKTMSFEELALAKSALGEIERWDSPLENGHWTSHLYFGIEAKGSAITGGRLAVAVAESAKATRDLLGVYLRRRGLLGYLSQPGLLLEGIGWDLSGGIFKLYFTCDRKLCKRADVLETLAPSSDIHLEKRWVSLRFAGANLKETRTYAVQKQARLDAGTNPVLYSMSNSLLQRVDIQSTLGTQPPLLNLKSLPVPMMGRGIQDIAKKQIQEFRFAADSIRLWNKDHAVLYYP